LEGSFESGFYAYRGLVGEARQPARAFAFPKRTTDNAASIGICHKRETMRKECKEIDPAIQCER
jgi:hypothetical protein